MTPSSRVTSTGVALVLTALLLLGPVPVNVDGLQRWVVRGTTVGDIVESGGIRAFPGDLLDVRGDLIRPRSGGAQVIEVNGAVATPETVVGPGARVVSRRGPNTIESTVAVAVEATPTMTYRGSGSVESIELSGVPGIVSVVRGAVSGIELARTLVSPGQPVTVRREPAWPGSKRVALTFDDGPWPGQTEQFVAALTDAGARGTFFMLGRLVTRNPAIARGVAAAGMEIGAHSQTHKLLRRAGRATVRREITRGIASIKKVTGVRPVFYRPAGGSVNGYVFLEARKAKVRVVMWTVDPHDYRKPGADVIARRILDNIRPGSVVLMHDGGGDRSQTLAALRIVLRGLAARGYETVTLSELYAKP